MKLTYRKLLELLSQLPDKWLDADVSCRVESIDEYYEATWEINEEDDILDKNHPVIVVKG